MKSKISKRAIYNLDVPKFFLSEIWTWKLEILNKKSFFKVEAVEKCLVSKYFHAFSPISKISLNPNDSAKLTQQMLKMDKLGDVPPSLGTGFMGIISIFAWRSVARKIKLNLINLLYYV